MLVLLLLVIRRGVVAQVARSQVNAFLERVLSNPVKELPMSAIFSTVVAMILNLKRTCPKCGRDQIVPKEKRREKVPCKFCGADIPPPR